MYSGQKQTTTVKNNSHVHDESSGLGPPPDNCHLWEVSLLEPNNHSNIINQLLGV